MFSIMAHNRQRRRQNFEKITGESMVETNYWTIHFIGKIWKFLLLRIVQCTCQLVLAISCKNLSKSAKSQKKRRNFSKSHLQSKIRIRLSCDLEQNQIQVLKLFPCKEYDTGFKDLTPCMVFTISGN